MDYLRYTVDHQPYTRGYEYQPNDYGCQCLILAVAIVVALVARFPGYLYEYQHYGVGDEVAERVHGVGGHRGAAPYDTGNEFEDYEQGIDSSSCQCHLVDTFFAGVHGGNPGRGE